MKTDRTLFGLLGISRLCPPRASGTSETPNIFSCSILELKQEINLAVEFCVKHLMFLTPVMTQRGRAVRKLLLSCAKNENRYIHKKRERGKKKKEENVKGDLTKVLFFFPPDLTGLSLAEGHIWTAKSSTPQSQLLEWLRQ